VIPLPFGPSPVCAMAAAEGGKGRVFVVTGASAGLGLEAALALAAGAPPPPAPRTLLVLAGRDGARLAAAAERAGAAGNVDAAALRLDLSSLADVKRFAGAVEARAAGRKIDGLLLNAGITARGFAWSPDGVESTWATNHLVGPLPCCAAAGPAAAAAGNPRRALTPPAPPLAPLAGPLLPRAAAAAPRGAARPHPGHVLRHRECRAGARALAVQARSTGATVSPNPAPRFIRAPARPRRQGAAAGAQV
jgi:NAD(P)-dependent dehydrogenase (short-subunit alcohol dehydrogenase family)